MPEANGIVHLKEADLGPAYSHLHATLLRGRAHGELGGLPGGDAGRPRAGHAAAVSRSQSDCVASRLARGVSSGYSERAAADWRSSAIRRSTRCQARLRYGLDPARVGCAHDARSAPPAERTRDEAADILVYRRGREPVCPAPAFPCRTARQEGRSGRAVRTDAVHIRRADLRKMDGPSA